MKAWLVWFVLVAAAATPLRAQGLEGRLRDLFIFGTGDNVLVLGGSAASDNPAIQVHGMHFVPAAVAGNATLISFLTNSISANVTNIPLSASSGGQTFRFEGATPVATSISAGPIYAERAQTLGRGRLFVGLSRSGLQYKTLRGVPMDDIRFTFAHANVDFEGCDSIFNGDCSLYGIPTLENETIDFNLDLNVSVDVTDVPAHLRHHQRARLRRGRAVREHVPPRHQQRRGHPLRPERAAGPLLLGHAREPGVHRVALLRRLRHGPGRRVGAGQAEAAGGNAGIGGGAGRREVSHRQRGGPARLRRGAAPRARHRVGAPGRLLAPREHGISVPRRGPRYRFVPDHRGLRSAPGLVGHVRRAT